MSDTRPTPKERELLTFWVELAQEFKDGPEYLTAVRAQMKTLEQYEKVLKWLEAQTPL